MSEDIPTVYHGTAGVPTDEDIQAVDRVLQAVSAAFNELPQHLMGRAVASVTLTLIMASSNPIGALRNMAAELEREIVMMAAAPGGSA